MSPITVNS